MEARSRAESRQKLAVELAALPGEYQVPGFEEAYRLHQMKNHESAVLILLKLAGYALIALGGLLLVFGPRSVSVSALYGPTLLQQLLMVPQLPLIIGIFSVTVVARLQTRFDRQPLPVLAFFDCHYLLQPDQPLPADQAMSIRYLGEGRLALRLVARVAGAPAGSDQGA